MLCCSVVWKKYLAEIMTLLKLQYLILMHFITWPFSFTAWFFGHVFCVFPLSEGMQHTVLLDAAVYKQSYMHILQIYFREEE